MSGVSEEATESSTVRAQTPPPPEPNPTLAYLNSLIAEPSIGPWGGAFSRHPFAAFAADADADTVPYAAAVLQLPMALRMALSTEHGQPLEHRSGSAIGPTFTLTFTLRMDAPKATPGSPIHARNGTPCVLHARNRA